MTSNEKVSMRVLAMFIKQNEYTKDVIKRYNTGTYKYMIICEHIPNKGIVYSVNKRTNSGKHLGTIVVDEVNRYNIKYSNELFSIPESLIKYIREHTIRLNLFMDIGEKAFTL